MALPRTYEELLRIIRREVNSSRDRDSTLIVRETSRKWTLRFDSDHFAVGPNGLISLGLEQPGTGTPPSDPDGGDLFYDTDTGWLYHWDDIRGKWLSAPETFAFGINTTGLTTAQYMRSAGNVLGSATKGFHLPFPATITAFTASWANSSTMTFNIRRAGSTLVSVSTGGTPGTFVQSTTLDADGGLGGPYALHFDAPGSSIDEPVARVWYRRHFIPSA